MIGDDSQDLRGRLLDVRDESIVLKKSAVRGRGCSWECLGVGVLPWVLVPLA
jgi:hypothetical protein